VKKKVEEKKKIEKTYKVKVEGELIDVTKS